MVSWVLFGLWPVTAHWTIVIGIALVVAVLIMIGLVWFAENFLAFKVEDDLY